MKKNDNFYVQSILNLDGTKNEWTLYKVFFYDDPIPVLCRAENSNKAEILAMAVRIINNESYGVEKVVNTKSGEYFPSIVSIY